MSELEVRGFGACMNEAEASYFRAVQDFVAKEEDGVFFIDCEEGKSVIEPDFYASDLSGWIIPADRADEFEAHWPPDDYYDALWRDSYVFIRWGIEDDGRLDFLVEPT